MRLPYFLITLLLASQIRGDCCSPLLRLSGTISVANESAIIVWDENTQTEHFIRNAEFRTDQSDIGFLVPTPGVPKLEPVDTTAFHALDSALRPRVIHRYSVTYLPVSILEIPLMRFLGGTAADKLHNVSVMSEGRVGDYDAAVLRASNPGDLMQWLNKNGYRTRPAVQAWLKTYVDRHWIITAFKVAQTTEKSDGLELDPVCMTFHTEQPFYPYSEPSDITALGDGNTPRLLRVFMIADRKMDGDFDGLAETWPHQTVSAKPWGSDNIASIDPRESFCGQLHIPQSSISDRSWLTVFEDKSSPRRGIADLVFTSAAAQTEVTPPPQINVIPTKQWFWIDPFLIAGWIIWRFVKRRRYITVYVNVPSSRRPR